MEVIGNIESAREKVLQDVKNLIDEMRSIIETEPSTVDEGVLQLAQIRECAYEDLNQIQHEYLILQSANWLVERGEAKANFRWSWNPRQTGGADEPDLQAKDCGNIVISCEITTSRRPIGTIADRMKKTLAKLSEFEGKKYYFVRTQEMCKRATKYIGEAGWDISPVCIEIEI